MLIVLSPAKALDFETAPGIEAHSRPAFIDDAEALVQVMREKSPAELAGLMKLSDPLAALNVARYQNWRRRSTRRNARQAVLAFDGDVYAGLDARSLDEDALRWAQDHLRILSGLYGVLRPLDLIQPYRLEMGSRLATARGRNLYDFWGGQIAQALRRTLLRSDGEPALVNLASQEYFRSVDPAVLRSRVVTPVFEDWNSGRYRIVSFFAKRARGLMARFAIRHRVTDPEALKNFAEDGYGFVPAASGPDNWVFRRQNA